MKYYITKAGEDGELRVNYYEVQNNLRKMVLSFAETGEAMVYNILDYNLFIT